MNDDVALERIRMTDRLNFRPCETNFPLSDAFVNFFMTNGFFAELGRHLRKIPTNDVPTACVTFDCSADEFCLFWNPTFFESLSVAEVQGLLHHEMYHLTFEHLLQMTDPATMNIRNIAQDLAINSIIDSCKSSTVQLPSFGIVPGRVPTKPDGTLPSKDEVANDRLLSLISTLQSSCSTQQYFQSLIDAGIDDASCGGWTLDVHLCIDPESEEYSRSKLDALLKIAMNYADAHSGWGSIPQRVQTALRQHLSRTVDWRSVLDRFVGSSVKGKQRSSVKRINKRYPYVHSGRTVSHRAKMLIAIDQSGSVDDGMLSQFFDALRSLTRLVDIDVLPFDCSADSNDIFAWRKGSTPELRRVLQGGTNFSAPTMIVNDPLNRHRWDAVLIMTDGEAAEPCRCSAPRAWVLPKDKKLLWSSPETIIRLTESQALLESM